MAIVAPLQSRFDGGEVSPRLYGRVDAERYKASMALCKNFIPTLQGGLPRRPGTYYIGATAGNGVARLVRFAYSTTQAYALEFGHQYIKFYANYGTVLKDGNLYGISTPYSAADIFDLQFVQSADVLYIVHPKYAPRKLMRLGATNWKLEQIVFPDGPYHPINRTQITFYPVGTSTAAGVTTGPNQSFTAVEIRDAGATVRITVANHGWSDGQPIYIANVVGVTGINGSFTLTVVDENKFDVTGTFTGAWISGGDLHPTGFLSSAGTVMFDSASVGFPVRIQTSSSWGWGILNSMSTPYSFNLTLKSPISVSEATKSWQWPLFKTDNFPSTATFHEDRLALSGVPSMPQRVDLSVSSDYENFSPSKIDGSVIASNALSFNLNANDVNAVEWMSSDEKALLAGSVSAEWPIRPSTSSEAMSPTNVSAKRSSKWGSSSTAPVQVGKATMYIQRGGRKLREMMYSFDVEGYRATDLTELAEHITGRGITQMAHCALPISVVWMIRDDGALIGMIYDRDATQLRVGWHQHELGGQSDASGTMPIVESIASIPSPDGTQDDLWMVVRRYINGATVRTVEYLTKVFEGIDEQNLAFHVDCGLTYDVPVAITAATAAAPIAVTSNAHGLTTGKSVRFSEALGLVKDDESLLNGKTFVVTVTGVNTFTLDGSDGTLATPYVSGGFFRKLVTTISGFTHLLNETVTVFADGVSIPDQVVSNAGVITLADPAATVSIGYPYNSDGKLLRLEAGSRNGTALGKTRRTHRVGVMVHRSQGLKIGASFDALDSVEATDSTELYSDIASQTVEFDYDFNNQICFRVDSASPCMVLAVMPMMETQDRT